MPPAAGEEDESFIMAAGVADFENEVVKPNLDGSAEETMFDDDITSALLNGIDERNQFHNLSQAGEVSITATDGSTSLMFNQNN